MIKRTLYFTNPAYLSLRHGQLVIELRDQRGSPGDTTTRPIEDIGLILIENRQITLSAALLACLSERNVAVAVCDERHMPAGLLLPMVGNSVMTERIKAQIDSSQPLRKQLWQQTIIAKVSNQATVPNPTSAAEIGCMTKWATQVTSGDTTNIEARAAVYYWKNLFPHHADFTREQDGLDIINSMLNYGYAILRAVIARSLVGSGLHPAIGIFHRNRYNAFCLADDVMEPYRPIVDRLVYELIFENPDIGDLSSSIKQKLLQIPVIDVRIGRICRPLMIAATMTSASLARCFSGESRKLVYPHIIP